HRHTPPIWPTAIFATPASLSSSLVLNFALWWSLQPLPISNECNYYSPQGTCKSVYTGRNLLFFQKITRCFDLTLIHWHYHLIHRSQLKIDNTRALF
ncbi:hypothetical protein H5410_060214, partial [Solanum commersonii]